MPKRQRIDSISAAVKTASAASRAVVAPSHIELTDRDAPFWRSVIAEFALSEWTDHQLEVAAQLAKGMADLEGERNALRIEGYVITDERGKPSANPRHGVARDLTNSVMSLRRNLSLHARAQGGEARDVATRRVATKDIEAGLKDDGASLLN